MRATNSGDRLTIGAGQTTPSVPIRAYLDPNSRRRDDRDQRGQCHLGRREHRLRRGQRAGLQPGSFTVANGRNFTTVGALTSSGTLAGTGGSTLCTNGGDYIQGGGSSFQIQIDAANPAGFLQLTGSGTAHLAGTLKVALVSGYMPPPNQTFVIFQAAAIDGQFDQVVGAAASYTATEVIITPRRLQPAPR